ADGQQQLVGQHQLARGRQVGDRRADVVGDDDPGTQDVGRLAHDRARLRGMNPAVGVDHPAPRWPGGAGGRPTPGRIAESRFAATPRWWPPSSSLPAKKTRRPRRLHTGVTTVAEAVSGQALGWNRGGGPAVPTPGGRARVTARPYPASDLMRWSALTGWWCRG